MIIKSIINRKKLTKINDKSNISSFNNHLNPDKFELKTTIISLNSLKTQILIQKSSLKMKSEVKSKIRKSFLIACLISDINKISIILTKLGLDIYTLYKKKLKIIYNLITKYQGCQRVFSTEILSEIMKVNIYKHF